MDVRVWRLYTLLRQYRCFSAWRLSLSHFGDFELTPQGTGMRDQLPPHRALMACYRHVLGALNVRHSQRHS
jgi:hypothetical protein